MAESAVRQLHASGIDHSPLGTALVFSEPGLDGAASTLRQIREAGWSCIVADHIDRFRWLASVRRFGIIVIRGVNLTWCCEVMNALDPAARYPVVVLAPPRPEIQARLLDAGADHVLSLNCDQRLLNAAIRAAARRAQHNAPTLRFLEADGVRLDVWSRSVTLGQRPVPLTRTEFDLLQLLMTRAQTTVSHQEIIKTVWNWKYTGERNALRLQINRLREKLSLGPEKHRYIESVRGIGYRFVESVAQYAESGTPACRLDRAEETGEMLHAILHKINQKLHAAVDRGSAARALVETASEAGLCDTAAVFARAPGTDLLHLVTCVGNSPEWAAEVSGGLSLTGPYVASDTVRSGRTLHFVDVSSMAKKFGGTARLFRVEMLGSHLSVPLGNRDLVWGQIGFARRSDSPLPALHCTVLESAACLLGALFADDSGDCTREAHDCGISAGVTGRQSHA